MMAYQDSPIELPWFMFYRVMDDYKFSKKSVNRKETSDNDELGLVCCSLHSQIWIIMLNSILFEIHYSMSLVLK